MAFDPDYRHSGRGRIENIEDWAARFSTGGSGSSSDEILRSGYGFKAWTTSPVGLTTSEAPSSGNMRAAAFPVAAGTLITNLVADFGSGASGLTLAKLSLYDLSFNKLTETNSFHATLNGYSGGWLSVALPSPYTTTSGPLYVTVLMVGTTPAPMEYVSSDNTSFGANNFRSGWQQNSLSDTPATATPVSGSHLHFIAAT